MKKLVAASALSLAAAATAHAAPFSSVDPRTVGMGGVGVAIGNSQSAGFYNPSLLTYADPTDDFTFALGFGVQASDPDDLLEAVDDFQDEDYIDRLEMSIDWAESNQSPESFRDVAEQLRATSGGLESVSNRHFQGELGVALPLSAPTVYRGVSVGLHLANSTYVSAVGRYNDGALLEAVASEMSLAADCAVDGIENCDLDGFEYIRSDGTIDFDPEEQLQSEVEFRGVAISEVGVSLAREFSFDGLPAPISFGLTPKLMRVDTFGYRAGVDEAELDDAIDEAQDYTDFNLDFGVSSRFANGFTAGLVLKNLIAQEYELNVVEGPEATVAETVEVELKPQARAGVSYSGSFYTVAMDLDLTENPEVGFEEPTRFFSVGGELDAWGWAQLRAGVRYDTVDSDRSTASVGVGLSPFRGVVHLDLAVVGSSDTVGAALRLGSRF